MSDAPTSRASIQAVALGVILVVLAIGNLSFWQSREQHTVLTSELKSMAGSVSYDDALYWYREGLQIQKQLELPNSGN